MTKNEVKLHTKIEKLLPQINEMYLTTYQFHSTQPLDVLESWLMILKQRVIEPSIEFVYGKGKNVHQRQVEALEDYIEKWPVKTRLSCPNWR